jgi:hypothetical protein
MHEKMVYRLNSHYEMLFIAEKNNVIYDGLTLSQIIASYSEKGEEFVDNISNIDPMLAISMPELEEWNASTWDSDLIPDVAAITEGDKNAYLFGEGKEMFEQDVYSNPAKHTLTVWSAEAVYLINGEGFNVKGSHIDDFMPSKPETCTSPYLEKCTEKNKYMVNNQGYYLIGHDEMLSAYISCIESSVPNGEGNGSPEDPCDCPRDCEKEDETLIEFKINGWGVFKNIKNQFGETKFVFHGDWVAGKYDVTTNISESITAKYVSPQQKKFDLLDCSGSTPCRGRFIKSNYRLWTDWDKDKLGTPYAISWAEVDPGEQTVGISIPLAVTFGKEKSPIKFSVGLAPKIERKGSAIVELGDQRVFYCDPILKDNDTGSITFRCN